MIFRMQQEVPEIARWFPHPIDPIVPEGSFKYTVPKQLRSEVEDFVERGARKKYNRIKKIYEGVSVGT
jgi:hypothetical protein